MSTVAYRISEWKLKTELKIYRWTQNDKNFDKEFIKKSYYNIILDGFFGLTMELFLSYHENHYVMAKIIIVFGYGRGRQKLSCHDTSSK